MQPKSKSKSKSMSGPLSKKEVREIAVALKKGNGGIIVVPFKNGIRQSPAFIPTYNSASAQAHALERLRQTLLAMGCDKGVCVRKDGSSSLLI